jgi:hypothetical protein
MCLRGFIVVTRTSTVNMLRPQNLATLLAALAMVVFFAAKTAHAFTIDTQSGSNADGSAKFSDPDEEIQNFTSGKGTVGQSKGFFNLNLWPFSGADRRAPLTSGYPQDRALPDR